MCFKGAAFLGSQAQQTFNPAADRLADAETVTAFGVKADAALGGADGDFIADGQHQLLAQIEPPALLRVGLLGRVGEQGEGMGQIPEAFWTFIPSAQRPRFPPWGFQRPAALGPPRLIPAVLNKLKEDEL